MTFNELMAATRKAKRVVAWVNLTQHEGMYIRVSKPEFIRLAKAAFEGKHGSPFGLSIFRACLSDDGEELIVG